MVVPLSILAAATLALIACAPPAIEGGFDSANPAARLYAIEQAMRSGDTSAVPQLVEQLDADDPLVRMMAIDALERITGETYGYRFDDPPVARQRAIRTWVASLEPSARGHLANTASPYDEP